MSEEIPARPTYRSFLVRCWRVGGAAERPAVWRFVVLEVGGRTPRRAFSDLDGLVGYLRGELDDDRPQGLALRAEEVNGD